jgi:antitoxin (DNA-binding transcriptional repressor) of toxin-antitoxin stability system
MKTIGLKQATLDACIKNAQHERLVITRDGKPVALIVGVEGMDKEQLQLGSSDKFWELIEKRRKDKIISRVELEQKLKKNGNRGRRQKKARL